MSVPEEAAAESENRPVANNPLCLLPSVKVTQVPSWYENNTTTD